MSFSNVFGNLVTGRCSERMVKPISIVDDFQNNIHVGVIGDDSSKIDCDLSSSERP